MNCNHQQSAHSVTVTSQQTLSRSLPQQEQTQNCKNPFDMVTKHLDAVQKLCAVCGLRACTKSWDAINVLGHHTCQHVCCVGGVPCVLDVVTNKSIGVTQGCVSCSFSLRRKGMHP